MLYLNVDVLSDHVANHVLCRLLDGHRLAHLIFLHDWRLLLTVIEAGNRRLRCDSRFSGGIACQWRQQAAGLRFADAADAALQLRLLWREDRHRSVLIVGEGVATLQRPPPELPRREILTLRRSNIVIVIVLTAARDASLTQRHLPIVAANSQLGPGDDELVFLEANFLCGGK